MMVTFEWTLEEAVESSLRARRGARAQRRIERGFGLATAIALGTAFGWPIGGVAGVLTGAAAAAASMALYLAVLGPLHRMFARHAWRPFFTGRDTLATAVELAPDGIHLIHGGIETRAPWRHVPGAREEAGGVRIEGLMFIPPRAFTQSVEPLAFAAAINERAARER